jgi:hypothetical protein
MDELTQYELSKLSKLVGFDEQNGNYAFSEDGTESISIFSVFYKEERYPYQTTTQTSLARWLREKYNIHVNPYSTDFYNDGIKYFYTIRNNNEDEKYHYKKIDGLNDAYGFDTYEEALEQGLIIGLKLIDNY